MTPEKCVQSAIMAYLASLQKAGEPIFFERRQAGGFSYKEGIPDLYAVYNGIHIEIEVKAPGGHLRTMQEKFRDRCSKIGIEWTCVNNVENFKAYMDTLKKRMHLYTFR